MIKISDEKLQAKIKFKPHSGQQSILDCNQRDIAICAGRRFGKSAICAYIVLKMLLLPGKKIWIVAPTYDLTQKVFDYLVKWFLKVAPSQKGSVSYRPFPKIRTARNSICECKSAENPTSLLGEEVDLRIVDECSRIPRRVEETYLFPTTSSRLGKSIYISTPFGKNWFYQKWLVLKEEGAAFHFTTKDNPYFPIEEWERAKQKLPEQVFKQEYMALFLEDAAAVFRRVRDIIGNCLQDSLPGRWYIMGVDLAKYEDFTVLTVIDRQTKSVVYFDRFREIDYPFQKTRIIATAKRYNNARIIVDSTGVGQPICDDLKRERLIVDDFKFSGKSKQELIEKLSIFIEQKHLAIPDNEILLDELESYGYNLTEAGNVRYSAPQGLHDDCVISLGLAVWGLNPGKGQLQTWENIPKELQPKKRSLIKTQSYI